jgi:hypothetical protein
MFPPLISLAHDEPVTGKVFGYQIDRPGMVVTRRVVTANREAWRQCLECPDFDACYRLSTGTVLMEIAVKP